MSGAARKLASLNRRVKELYRAGEYAAALDAAEAAEELARARYPGTHPQVGRAVSNRGAVLQSQGRLDEAEACYEEALRIDRTLFGDDSPSVAMALHNLAALRDQQGRYASAERLYHRAVSIFARDPGEASEPYAVSLANLAMLQKERGRYAAAERKLRRVLRIRRGVAWRAKTTRRSPGPSPRWGRSCPCAAATPRGCGCSARQCAAWSPRWTATR